MKKPMRCCKPSAINIPINMFKFINRNNIMLTITTNSFETVRLHSLKERASIHLKKKLIHQNEFVSLN